MIFKKTNIFWAAGLAVLLLPSWGCDYARMNDQESVRTYEKKMPEMDGRTVPVDRGYQFLVNAEPKELKNPRANTPSTVSEGKVAYGYFCIQCHGPKADGNGTVGQSFAPLPANLGSPDVQAQSDGEIYAKIRLGFARHPALFTTVSEEDGWALVQYIRSMKR